ncbi:MAG: IS110 family transposase [Thiohalocapsa sp. PB-PSB1]|jgi:transposase|nr:MAG: IS110 family transposase [Thiohalocapsa sp. PB-PSB1]
MKVAGIDVDSKKTVVACHLDDKKKKPQKFDNTPDGHLSIIKALQKAGVTRVCLEATGTYHLDLAVALHDAGFEVMVINPKAARRFFDALQNRSKTDSVDATMLAEFAQRMPFEPWQRPEDDALRLRAYARRIAALKATRTQAKNQLHAATQTALTPPALIDDIKLRIAQLDAQIATLQAHAKALIDAAQELREAFELLVSVTGIATASALQILAELCVLPPELSAKQWVAMAGLDPRHFQSGTSVNKKPRLAKAGNRYLRMALFMPALSASRHDPNMRAYFLHLVEDRGLKKIQAICAVMRQLLHAIHGMLKTRTPFDGARFYGAAETVS